jgi:hypothetical protein
MGDFLCIKLLEAMFVLSLVYIMLYILFVCVQAVT